MLQRSRKALLWQTFAGPSMTWSQRTLLELLQLKMEGLLVFPFTAVTFNSIMHCEYQALPHLTD